jgi:hypothetical protein
MTTADFFAQLGTTNLPLPVEALPHGLALIPFGTSLRDLRGRAGFGVAIVPIEAECAVEQMADPFITEYLNWTLPIIFCARRRRDLAEILRRAGDFRSLGYRIEFFEPRRSQHSRS